MLYNTLSLIEGNVPKNFKIGYFLPKFATWAKIPYFDSFSTFIEIIDQNIIYHCN